jgi:excisionase family DNA binding protein
LTPLAHIGETLRFVPGPQFGDLKRQEGSGVIALATPAVPPAADCGTAPPCGGRPYGGPAVPLTFGLLPNKWIKRSPIRHQGGMERNAPPITFFTERTLAAYLAVSDRTIRNWIRRGELPSYKLGASRRIDPADVDTFLAQRRELP